MKKKIDLDTNEYKIGDEVKVSAKISILKSQNKRILNRTELKEPLFGQIVGIKKLQEGKIHMSWGYSADNYEPGYLFDIKTKFFWKVRLGLLNKSIYVKPEDLEKTDEEIKIPVLYTKQPVWTEKDKEFLRETMKDIPRDKKGRWVKT